MTKNVPPGRNGTFSEIFPLFSRSLRRNAYLARRLPPPCRTIFARLPAANWDRPPTSITRFEDGHAAAVWHCLRSDGLGRRP